MTSISIAKKHHLPHKKAKDVAEKIAKDLKRRFELDYAWDGDHVAFERPGVSGRMLVEKPSGKVARDAFSRATIPEFWNAPLFPVTGEDHGCFIADCRDVSADHGVGALFDGDWTFGVFA